MTTSAYRCAWTARITTSRLKICGKARCRVGMSSRTVAVTTAPFPLGAGQRDPEHDARALAGLRPDGDPAADGGDPFLNRSAQPQPVGRHPGLVKTLALVQHDQDKGGIGD